MVTSLYMKVACAPRGRNWRLLGPTFCRFVSVNPNLVSTSTYSESIYISLIFCARCLTCRPMILSDTAKAEFISNSLHRYMTFVSKWPRRLTHRGNHPQLTRRLFLLPTTKQTTKSTSSTLRAIRNRASRRRRGPSHALTRRFRVVGNWVGVRASRASIISLFVLAAPLGAVDAFFGSHVANRLKEPAFADLAADDTINTVLEFVDLIDAGDLGFVERVY